MIFLYFVREIIIDDQGFPTFTKDEKMASMCWKIVWN